MSNRVLLIEDDPELSELVAEYLRGEGWEVDVTNSGEAGLELAQRNELAAVVLDVMLPGISGFEVLRRLRGAPKPLNHLPVVMLTARGDEVDRVLGLEMGADDYLPKPFSSRELAARLRAVLRRTQQPTIKEEIDSHLSASRQLLRVGTLEIDMGARIAQREGVPLELTALELRLLELLMRHAGEVVTRESIAHDVLGRQLLPYDRSVDTHMSNLRRKLVTSEAENEDTIKTIRGVGYILTLPAVARA